MSGSMISGVEPNRFYRFSPMIFIAVILVIPSAQKELVFDLMHRVCDMEAIIKQYTIELECDTWGRNVLCATSENVQRFRDVVLRGKFSDPTMVLNYLKQLLGILNALKDGSTVEGYSYTWQVAAIPSYTLPSAYFSMVDHYLDLVHEFYKPTDYAVQLAMQRGGLQTPVAMFSGVTSDVFPAWDNHKHSNWYFSADAPYEARCTTGTCYQRLGCTRVQSGVAKWPTKSQVMARPYNPFIRCVHVGGDKWHVPSKDSQWYDGCVPFIEIPENARIGGVSDDVLPKELGSLMPSRLPATFSELIKYFVLGEATNYVGSLDRTVLASAEAPYTPILRNRAKRRFGFLVVPYVLIPVRGRISVSATFGSKFIAAYLRISGNSWSPVGVQDFSVNFMLSSTFPLLMMFVFDGEQKVSDQFDFVAAMASVELLSKL